ncbi:MAG: hypothetical protein KJZ77_17485 [Anaerolineales bacterium]|nr:hypothetical protein [Anaerolineales bacterium]
MSRAKSKPKEKDDDLDFVRMYYEHQYDRIEKNENHRLTISNYVLTLSAVAFTFGFQNGLQLTALNGIGLPVIIVIANMAAISNIGYTATFIDIHRNRAHEILQRYAPQLSKVDETYDFDSGLLNRRRKVEKRIHQLLILLSLLPLGLYIYQAVTAALAVP